MNYLWTVIAQYFYCSSALYLAGVSRSEVVGRGDGCENVCSISASLEYRREEEGHIPIRRYQPFQPGLGHNLLLCSSDNYYLARQDKDQGRRSPLIGWVKCEILHLPAGSSALIGPSDWWGEKYLTSPDSIGQQASFVLLVLINKYQSSHSAPPFSLNDHCY